VIVFITTCSDTTSVKPIHTQNVILQDVIISPINISFKNTAIQKDTTINLTFAATVTDTSLIKGDPYFTIIDLQSEQAIASGRLTDFDKSKIRYSTIYPLQLNTTTFVEYQVYIFAIDKQNQSSNRYQTIITVQGNVGEPPVVLNVSNPDTVQIPTGSNINNIDFKAKVTDPDGQSNIDSVLVNLVSQNTGKPLTGSPYLLYDDGGSTNVGGSVSGDAFKGDSVYTRRFQVSSSNTADKLTVSYFAVDKTGLHSDTTTTHLVFVK
jgi:hypothetical protein